MSGAYKLKRYELDLFDELGKGSYGTVYRGVNLDDGTFVAAKKMKYKEKGSHTSENMALKEADILTKLQGHRNLVNLIEFFQQGDYYWFIMEFCELGDLAEYVQSHTVNLREKVKVMLDTARGLEFMHSCKPPIVHRDIKPTNVLMKMEGHIVVAKLGDFGMGKLYKVDTNQLTMTTLGGTASFWAPELFVGKESLRYKPSVDTFALGLMFAVMLLHDPTSKEDSMTPMSVDIRRSKEYIYFGLEMANAVKNKEPMPVLFDPKEDNPMIADIKELIRQMIEYNDKDRASLLYVKCGILDIHNTLTEEQLLAKTSECENINKEHAQGDLETEVARISGLTSRLEIEIVQLKELRTRLEGENADLKEVTSLEIGQLEKQKKVLQSEVSALRPENERLLSEVKRLMAVAPLSYAGLTSGPFHQLQCRTYNSTYYLQQIVMINNEIWGCAVDAILIFNLECRQVREVSLPEIRRYRGVAECESGVLVAGHYNSGLHLIDRAGQYVCRVGEGCYAGVSVHAGRVYGLEYSKAKVVVYECVSSKWSQVGEFDLGYERAGDMDRICAHSGGVLVSSYYNDRLYLYSDRGALIHQAGEKGSGQPGRLYCPLLCGVDGSDTALVADYFNDHLKLYTAPSTWQVVTGLPGEVREPRSVVVDNRAGGTYIWVTTRDNKLYKFKINN